MKEFEILSEIVETVSGITREELVSKRRQRNLVEMRVICAKIFSESETNFTLEYIGSFMNVDHATVLHYYKVHQNLMTHNQAHIGYQKKYELIRNLYNSQILRESGVKLLLLHKRALLEKEIKAIDEKLAFIAEEDAKQKEVELIST